MKKFLILLAIISVLLLPSLPAKAFSLVDNLNADCSSNGNCTPCDILQVIFNFGKFIFMSTAALALLFGLWQASGMIMNWGNAEAVKVAKGKITSTLLAVFIILAAYFLVGALISTFSGNSIKDWNKGPTCETDRPTKPVSTGGTGTSGYTSGTYNKPTNSCGQYSTRGIMAEQCNDISPALAAMIDCIYNNVYDKNKMVITSISHNNGFTNCKTNYKSSCEHAQNSCHFGGSDPTATKSEAVDLGIDLVQVEMERAKSACSSLVGWGQYEGDHWHLSTKACLGK